MLLLDEPAGQSTFDDVELATLLAGIAGVAMLQAGPGVLRLPGGDNLEDLSPDWAWGGSVGCGSVGCGSTGGAGRSAAAATSSTTGDVNAGPRR